MKPWMMTCLVLFFLLLSFANGGGAGGPGPAAAATAGGSASRTLAAPGLGPGASLGGRRPFPVDNPWNQEIATAPVDPNSAALIASIGADTGLHADFGTVWNGAPNGIPYVVVSGKQARVPVSFD